jgi:hypothetical protein
MLSIKSLLNCIESTLKEVLTTEPGDFLLATKQEDYLSFRISSALTKISEKSYFPTQFERHDFVEIDNENAKIKRIFEAKFHYSSDFSKLFDYGEKCTRSDYEKLLKVNSGERYLIQFVIHFKSDDLTHWRNMLESNLNFFNRYNKYFTYLSNAELRRFNDVLTFRNKTNKLIYGEDFVSSFISELESYNLNIINTGHIKIDRSNSIIRICRTEYQIPHDFYCFIWYVK